MGKEMKVIKSKFYSRKEFSAYEIRAKVEFKLLDGSTTNFDIYTTETDRHNIREAINGMLNREKCITFEVVNYSTKEQDEASSRFVDEVFELIDKRDSNDGK